MRRDWVKWALFTGGLLSSWWTMGSGEMPFSAWLGIAAILTASAMGVGVALTGAALGAFLLRYTFFLAPLAKAPLGNTWAFATLTTILFTIWEGMPLWVAGTFGAWALRKRSVPGWALVLLVATLHLSLAAWLPRPYEFSWGAMFLHRLPQGIWLFGADLLGGLALGWVCLAARLLVLEDAPLPKLLIAALAPAALMGAALVGYDSWTATLVKAPKEAQSVITVQGDLPPFAGGFVLESQRALVPVVLYSMLKPDLVILPEDMMQVAGGLDPNEREAALRRHFTAVGTAIAAPYSQVVFGVRDWTTSRAYFTDLAGGKPDVFFKDLETRTPFIDRWPSFTAPIVHGHGFPEAQQIGLPEKTPAMGLQVHDDTGERGLRRVGSGLVLIGSEIRAPRLITKVRATPDAAVLVNPNIDGWLGQSEARGAKVQAEARSVELGLLAYRAGQLAGTGYFSPWENTGDLVRAVGPGILRFTGRIPKARVNTGYTGFFWISLYAAPWVFLALLGALVGLERGWITIPASASLNPLPAPTEEPA